MTPHYEDDAVTLYAGDCLDVLRQLPDASVDAVVTDPPYGLEFMGREWDAPWKAAGDVVVDPADVGGFQDGNGGNPFSRSRIRYGREGDSMRAFQDWCEQWATECLRVLKPGGHMLAFGGTRTWHRLACAIEDAGFEVRDSIAWLYGSGFPKSLDVSKAIDRAAGARRESLGRVEGGGRMAGDNYASNDYNGGWHGVHVTAPATDDARKWQGWGTALKPAFEPIVVARKPLAGTVAATVLEWGTGALNIDASRVAHDEPPGKPSDGLHGRRAGIMGETIERHRETTAASTAGRWPPNVVLDGAAADELDQQSGTVAGAVSNGRRAKNGAMFDPGEQEQTAGYADSGGASRFFPTFRYEPKAGSAERPRDGETAHPTVKPLALMQWLVKLVTPPGGTVLEPFAGSGTTAEACVIEGFKCIAIERDETYLPLIVARLTKPIQVGLDFGEPA